jgi:hypothetical protein
MGTPYSLTLFAPTHPANQQKQLTPRCCLDAHEPTDYILCATCYKHKPQQVLDDDWGEESPVPVKHPLPTSHKISNDFEGPLWQ